MDVLKEYLIKKRPKKNVNRRVVVIPPVELTVTPSEGLPIQTP
jgi:hypothetical protein